MYDQTFLIALGGNLPSEYGPPDRTLTEAFARLPQLGVRVVAKSHLYLTPCFPVGAGPDYVNAAAKVTFDGKPAELLHLLHAVEAEFDRARDQRWGQRTLDLDLLAAGDVVWPDVATFREWQNLALEKQMRTAPEKLILPHPRLHERAFVLVPLNDVASDWRHPVLGRTVAEMMSDLPGNAVAEVRVLA